MPVEHFYEGTAAADPSPLAEERAAALAAAMTDALTLRLVEAFAILPDAAVRRGLVDLVEAMAMRARLSSAIATA